MLSLLEINWLHYQFEPDTMRLLKLGNYSKVLGGAKICTFLARQSLRAWSSFSTMNNWVKISVLCKWRRGAVKVLQVYDVFRT